MGRGGRLGLVPSPSLTSVSIDLCKFPFSPLSTVMFRLSSLNPISRSVSNFDSKSSAADIDSPTAAPNTFDCLLCTIGGDCGPNSCARASAFLLDFEDIGNMEVPDLKPNLLLWVFGGKGGGEWRSSDSVLPVSCRL